MRRTIYKLTRTPLAPRVGGRAKASYKLSLGLGLRRHPEVAAVASILTKRLPFSSTIISVISVSEISVSLTDRDLNLRETLASCKNNSADEGVLAVHAEDDEPCSGLQGPEMRLV